MARPGSRYFETLRPKSDGATTPQGFRIVEPAPGEIEHVIQQHDRLDLLAAGYLDDPQLWWMIADANPLLPSPLALLGHDPTRTIAMTVDLPARTPTSKWPLAGMMRAIRDIPSVRSAVLGPLADQAHDDDKELVWIVDATFSSLDDQVVAAIHKAATEAVVSTGGNVGAPRQVGRLGKPLAIPLVRGNL